MTPNDIYEIASWAIATFLAYYFAIKYLLRAIKELEARKHDE